MHLTIISFYLLIYLLAFSLSFSSFSIFIWSFVFWCLVVILLLCLRNVWLFCEIKKKRLESGKNVSLALTKGKKKKKIISAHNCINSIQFLLKGPMQFTLHLPLHREHLHHEHADGTLLLRFAQRSKNACCGASHWKQCRCCLWSERP